MREALPASTRLPKMMKRLLFLAILCLPLASQAQQGSILYDEVVKFNIELPPEMERMRDQMPSSNTMKRILYFNETSTLMKNAPEGEKQEDTVISGDNVMIRMGGARDENETFTNIDEWKVIEKRDFLGREFLITGEPTEYAWRMTGEMSEYQGYKCQKAVAEVDSSTVEAWFTSEIPVAGGPGPYGGLPGMILVLSANDGDLVFTATEVSMDGVDPEIMKTPEGGKEVSREEFDQIVDEKMKEMGATRGRGGNAMIHIRMDG